MLLPSSSTSSSESKRSRRLRGVLVTFAWTLLALVGLDIAIGWVFAMPTDPHRKPSQMAQYFDYGRSVGGKITGMIGRDEAHSAPILVAGWIDRECRRVPRPAPAGHLGLTIYGMSFTNHIADQIEQIDPRFTISRYSGPGAPPSHSYACFEAVRRAGDDHNGIQVLGVLASSLPRMLALGGASTSFEAPQPFTFPRYEVDSRGGLKLIEPIVRSPEDLRQPAKRAAFETQLAQNDAFYDPYQFDGQWADRSVFLRLLRRAYAQAEFRSRSFRFVHDGTQFRANMGPLLRAILISFAREARARGQRPFVMLLQDRSTGRDSLVRLIGPSITKVGATVIRSDEIANVDDQRNFLPDGHFTQKIDRLLAQRLLAAINNPAK